jgi:hypothetical protein
MAFTKQTLFNRLSIAIAVMTFVGIAIHDTKIDKFTAMAIAVPVVMAAYEGAHLLHALGGDSHTHVDRISVEKTANKNTSMPPQLGARRFKDKKYRLDANVSKGHHSFDNYNLPIAV